MRARRRERGGTFNFWPVYSDLALSMILILLLVILAQQVRTLLETNVRATLVKFRQRQIEVELNGLAVEPSIDGNTQILTLSADSLFDSDETELTPAGCQLLLRVYVAIIRSKTPFTRISVEGHADYETSGKLQPGDWEPDGGNWRLSAERATQVAQLLQRAKFPAARLEVVGRSSYDPLDSAFLTIPVGERKARSKEYERSLRRNRRIALRLFYSEHGDDEATNTPPVVPELPSIGQTCSQLGR